jgi:predicted TIM-barrel enzyme
MGRRYTRAEVRARLIGEVEARRPIVVAGAGSGLTAKCAALGGVDLLVIYNSGRYRMAGLPSLVGYLPVGDANADVIEMGRREILPLAGTTPVIAGLLGVDPTRDIEHLLVAVRDAGFSGVINFPTVGRMDGDFRRALESVGLGYAREAAMIRTARALDLFTLAYCFTPDEAQLMAQHGVDVVVAHLKTTEGGLVGLRSAMSVPEAVETATQIFSAARRVSPDVLCLAHGGPLATPRETAVLYERSDAAGFVAASSIERLPTERAVTGEARAFKAQRLGARAAGAVGANGSRRPRQSRTNPSQRRKTR